MSSALRQRHHFLHITPENPLEYLAWPSGSPSQHRLINLLESLQQPIEHHDYPVRYSVDAESAFAHVAVPSDDPPGLRLIFQWGPDAWKYHNIDLLPFPSNTFESIQEAMFTKTDGFMVEPPVIALEDDEDSYWNSYTCDGDQEGRIVTTESEPSSTEDAYWARYTSVHGSGDSAIPTPPLMDAAKPVERVILPLFDHRPRRIYNPLEPPSPHALARCLADIPSRPESPPLDESDSSSALNFVPSLSPPSILLYCTDLNLVSTSLEPVSAGTDQTSEAPSDETKVSDEALRYAIRDIYHLWRIGRQTKFSILEEREDFIKTVRQVVNEYTQ